jgi:shikimate dehydrogenase
MKKTLRACVIGHPLGHSLSPVIHNYWMDRLNIKGHYDAVPIHPDEFDHAIGALSKNYDGVNVTLPYKEKIARRCVKLDPAARKIGAVNTVVVNHDGLYGYNTDAFGFTRNLERHVENFDWARQSALILGTGGAARAVIYALNAKNVKHIRIAGRDIERARNLAWPYDAEAIAWTEKDRVLNDTTLLINATPLGMTGQGALETGLHSMPGHAVIYDLVYAPRITPLLQKAAERGLRSVTGIGMLLYQAQAAFEIWTGIAPELDSPLESLVGEAKP